MRIDKNKDKKLRGKRKLKEDAFAADVTGGGFQIDLHDDRFKALLDGNDERFGIDRTDSNFKETQAMRDLLKEQTKRRKRRKRSSVGMKKKTMPAEDSGRSQKNDLDALVDRLKKNAKKK